MTTRQNAALNGTLIVTPCTINTMLHILVVEMAAVLRGIPGAAGEQCCVQDIIIAKKYG